MKVIRSVVVGASMIGLAGCYVGETFDSVTMRRASDGATAQCSSGTYGVGILGHSRTAGPLVTQCVAACERLGFVVIKSHPRADLVIKTHEVSDVSENYCFRG